MIIFIDLTMISSSNNFADKRHIAPKINLVNVLGLNKLLRSEVFISEDRQLRAVHLILDNEPLSRIYQDAGQAIRASDPRIHRIDVSKPSFLAREDLPPVELPLQRSPREVAVPREETASSRLFLEVEIDQFRLEKKERHKTGLWSSRILRLISIDHPWLILSDLWLLGLTPVPRKRKRWP